MNQPLAFVTVQCPQCRKLMKTAPRVFVKAVKRCVYCGKSFKIHTPGGETRIVVARLPTGSERHF
jgi:uncharacterized protein (DUF983 family)